MAERSTVVLNGYAVDLVSGQVTRDESRHYLSARSLEVLRVLLDSRGKIVSSGTLLQVAWPDGFVGDNAVYKAINEIRESLGDNAKSPLLIETIPRKGYRLLETAIIHTAANSPLPLSNKRGRRSGSVLAVTLACALFIYVWQVVLQPTTSMEVASNKVGKEVGLLFVDSDSEDTSPLFSKLTEEVANKVTSLGYTYRSVRTIEFEGSISELLANERLDHVVYVYRGNDDVRVEAYPFIGDVSFSYIVDGDDEASQMSALLDTLLDEKALDQMARLGTLSIDAYRLTKQAIVAQRRASLDGLLEARPLLLEAIEYDPKFSAAYVTLGCVLSEISQITSEVKVSEEAQDTLRDLADLAEVHGIEEIAKRSISRQLEYASMRKPIDIEVQWFQDLQESPSDPDALFRYSELLVGAGYTDEALAYMEKAASQLSPEEANALRLRRETDVYNQTDLVKANELAFRLLKEIPNDVVLLFAIVQRFAAIGDYTSALPYLERLRLSDESGVWAFSAEVTLQALRGDFDDDPDALQRVLNDPKMTNMMLGRLHFLMGNTQLGIAAWDAVEPNLRWLLGRFATGAEHLFPSEVVDDPEFQLLLDDFGVGRRWRVYLGTRLHALAPVTGIPATSEVPDAEHALLASIR